MIEIRDGKFWFNGVKKPLVWGRSSFKTSNILTYHWTGQGGGKYSLGFADRWVEHNQRLFGQDVVLRVFLETGGWSPCTDCMFGSEPQDKGFWERVALRDGVREQAMHGVGKQALNWFFDTSQRTGVAFELIIDATLKHDDIPKGEIDHVIRVVGIEMGFLAQQYPKALIIPNVRNEWNAHNQSGHTLAEVNMWAVRWDRDAYWPGAPKIVDPGGGNEFTYDVGPEDGKYRAGMIHPDRGYGWQNFPDDQQLAKLRADSRGMPVGFTESMYYVEPEDLERASRWYPGHEDRWTTDWTKYENFLHHVENMGIDYFIVHDEKGAQSDPEWPRPETRVESWARAKFGGVSPPPPDPTPPPPETMLTIRRNDHLELVVERDPEIVKGGSEDFVLKETFRTAVPNRSLKRLHVFHGLDRGDVVEMDTEIHADGQTLYVRSEHKEGTAPYDAWETVDFLERVSHIEITVVCRVNGENPFRPSGHRLEGRPHWGIRFVWGKATDNLGVDVEPEGRDSEEYVTLERAPGISAELTAELQESVWAGQRDIVYVSTHCPSALKPNPGALFPFTHAEMMDLAITGAALDSEGAGFLSRLATVNSRFPGRSEVLKARLAEFRVRLTAHLETARSLRNGLKDQPGYGVDFNSIAGWCRGQQ